MPIKSKAQQRAMYAAASGSGKTDIPASVAKEYIEATPKGSFKKLPEKVSKKRKASIKRKK